MRRNTGKGTHALVHAAKFPFGSHKSFSGSVITWASLGEKLLDRGFAPFALAVLDEAVSCKDTAMTKGRSSNRLRMADILYMHASAAYLCGEKARALDLAKRAYNFFPFHSRTRRCLKSWTTSLKWIRMLQRTAIAVVVAQSLARDF